MLYIEGRGFTGFPVSFYLVFWVSFADFNNIFIIFQPRYSRFFFLFPRVLVFSKVSGFYLVFSRAPVLSWFFRGTVIFGYFPDSCFIGFLCGFINSLIISITPHIYLLYIGGLSSDHLALVEGGSADEAPASGHRHVEAHPGDRIASQLVVALWPDWKRTS